MTVPEGLTATDIQVTGLQYKIIFMQFHGSLVPSLPRAQSCEGRLVTLLQRLGPESAH